MKQFIQNLNAPRTIAARFLAVAVLVAATFESTTHAQADPGRGAVVTHIDRDRTGWYHAESGDGLLRLDVATSGQGDLLRHNPDGTWTMEVIEPRAPMTLSVRGSDGSWVPMWIGSGSLHDIGLGEPAADGGFDFTNEDDHMHVEGKLTNVLDGSEWSLLVVVAVVDYEFKELRIELRPR